MSAPHATGHLSSVQRGLMEGAAEFPIRGRFALRLELKPIETPPEGRRPDILATLTVRTDAGAEVGRGDVMLFEAIPAGVLSDMPDGMPKLWHGHLAVEGYTYRACLIPGDAGMRVEFHDTRQRAFDPARLMAADEDGAVDLFAA